MSGTTLLRERDISLTRMDETGLGLVRADRDPTAVAHVASSGADSNIADTLDDLQLFIIESCRNSCFTPCIQVNVKLLLPELDPQILLPACVLRRKLLAS